MGQVDRQGVKEGWTALGTSQWVRELNISFLDVEVGDDAWVVSGRIHEWMDAHIDPVFL